MSDYFSTFSGDKLDISWLKDEREDDNGELPEPAIVAQEAIHNT